MEDHPVIVRDLLCFLVVGLLMIWGWRVLNWAWLTPKRLERCLRQQGLRGTPYRFLSGDFKQMIGMSRQSRAKPMPLGDDIEPYVTPFFHQLLNKYGKDSFIGLANLEGDHWSKHRKIINPAFHQDKLKNMLPAFYQSCSDMISKWEKMVSTEGFSDIDVWPYLVNMTRDVISRAAFGSSFEEGSRIFEMLDDQLHLMIKAVQFIYIPGWSLCRFLPTKTNRGLKMKYNDIKESLREMIKRREKAIKEGLITLNVSPGINDLARGSKAVPGSGYAITLRSRGRNTGRTVVTSWNRSFNSNTADPP
ncbi:hypothetical protein V6N13_085378 [Hibiscus sabdariffa]